VSEIEGRRRKERANLDARKINLSWCNGTPVMRDPKTGYFAVMTIQKGFFFRFDMFDNDERAERINKISSTGRVV
jgi:hypothetical protein